MIQHNLFHSNFFCWPLFYWMFKNWKLWRFRNNFCWEKDFPSSKIILPVSFMKRAMTRQCKNEVVLENDDIIQSINKYHFISNVHKFWVKLSPNQSRLKSGTGVVHVNIYCFQNNPPMQIFTRRWFVVLPDWSVHGYHYLIQYFLAILKWFSPKLGVAEEHDPSVSS